MSRTIEFEDGTTIEVDADDSQKLQEKLKDDVEYTEKIEIVGNNGWTEAATVIKQWLKHDTPQETRQLVNDMADLAELGQDVAENYENNHRQTILGEDE